MQSPPLAKWIHLDLGENENMVFFYGGMTAYEAGTGAVP